MLKTKGAGVGVWGAPVVVESQVFDFSEPPNGLGDRGAEAVEAQIEALQPPPRPKPTLERALLIAEGVIRAGAKGDK